MIGQGGKYVLRLEERYAVKITFPRESADYESKTREVLKSDEVLVKGGKKGVAQAKAELLDVRPFRFASLWDILTSCLGFRIREGVQQLGQVLCSYARHRSDPR